MNDQLSYLHPSCLCRILRLLLNLQWQFLLLRNAMAARLVCYTNQRLMILAEFCQQNLDLELRSQ